MFRRFHTSRMLLLVATAHLLACGDDTEAGSGGAATSAETTGSTTVSQSSANAGGFGGGGGDGGAGDGGTGGAGGSAGIGGSQGTGGFAFGDAIEAAPGEWTWVDFPDSRCINDTPTGIGVNPSATNSSDVMIFLMGGNACFNQISCAATANTDGYGADKFATEEILGAPLFNRDDPANPTADWSYVFIPYCTGDVHAGDRREIEVAGTTRRFRGYVNVHEYLERIVPTFPSATRVLLSGASAGGFGSAFHFEHVKEAFGPDVEVVLLDDSGPPMSEQFVPECLQAHFRATWGLDNTLPLGCADCFAGEPFVSELFDYMATTYASSRFGLVSSEADSTIRSFWAFGNDDCAELDALSLGEYPAAEFRAGLVDIDERSGDNFALFMPPGSRHVWMHNTSGRTTRIGDSPMLVEWMGQLIDGDPEWRSWLTD